MTSHIAETAFAKLNLALHVRARRPDGYHELDTLFAFVDDGDRIRVTPAARWSLTIDGPCAAGLSAGDDNLVLRAGQALGRAIGTPDCAAIHLEKRLPVAAGIGGGSADAAATLRALARLWGVGDADLLHRVAAGLGADVPACLLSVTQVGRGIGDQLYRETLDDVEGAPVLLVNPLVACPTGPVFAGWDGVDRGALNPAQWRAGRNDLQPPAIGLVPDIARVLDALRTTGASVVRMSGSGATCFALYSNDTDRNLAASSIRSTYAEWWWMAGQIR